MAYTTSDKVKKHEEDYYAHMQNKPAEFSSEYTAKADKALNNYVNRGEFKYNPATDTGYQAARKQYTRGGQQAMKDTLGTATELTGGYDNSYAQAAAQQTYNGYMAELANLMPQYEQQAYGRWQDQGQQMLDYYSLMKGAETDAYNKHMDSVNQYTAEANRLYGLYSDAVANDQWERNFAHTVEKDNASAVATQTNANANYYEALAKYENALAENEPLFYEYAGDALDDLGNITGKNFYYDGKLRTYDVGINPYTNTRNPDAKNGNTFSNGYQPDNVGGKKLKETGYEDDRNGKWQNIYTTGDGHYWVWNGRLNEYEEVENPNPDRAALNGESGNTRRGTK